MPEFLTPTHLVVLAGGLQIIGYLIIRQMLMRVLMLFGSLAYVAYYMIAADAPLWGAIVLTGLMMLANLFGMLALLARNARWSVPRAHADIYPLFAPLAPGDFRALMRLAKRHHLPAGSTITREGAPVHRLYYVLGGKPVIGKFGGTFPIDVDTFVGEVAYLRDGVSSATTTLTERGEVLEWDIGMLRRIAGRNPRIKLALDAVISQDLAQKVALAVAPAGFYPVRQPGGPAILAPSPEPVQEAPSTDAVQG